MPNRQVIKKRFGTKFIICGPHATTFPEEVSKYADHVVLREYELTVLEILQGKNPNDILGLYPNALRAPLDVNKLPLPEEPWHEIHVCPLSGAPTAPDLVGGLEEKPKHETVMINRIKNKLL